YRRSRGDSHQAHDIAAQNQIEIGRRKTRVANFGELRPRIEQRRVGSKDHPFRAQGGHAGFQKTGVDGGAGRIEIKIFESPGSHDGAAQSPWAKGWLPACAMMSLHSGTSDKRYSHSCGVVCASTGIPSVTHFSKIGTVAGS